MNADGQLISDDVMAIVMDLMYADEGEGEALMALRNRVVRMSIDELEAALQEDEELKCYLEAVRRRL